MKTGYKRVRSGKELVDVAEFPIFENLTEMVNHFGGGATGEKEVFELAQSQNTTNIMNTTRALYNTELSESKLDEMANEALFNLMNSDEGMATLASMKGDKAKLTAWKNDFKEKAKNGAAGGAGKKTPEQAKALEAELVAKGLLKASD